MNILIDIGHPAHVHVFKNFAHEMLRNGSNIFFTCREKEFEVFLMSHYGFNFKSFGNKFNTSLGKLFGLIKFDISEIIEGIKFQPDIFLSCGSMYAAHASFVLAKPHITLEDTYNFEQVRLYKSFTNTILTGNYEHPLKSKKVINYPGYHELAYLHPNRFNPDKSVLKELGVKEADKFIIIRFVSWNASHDIGHKGISLHNKIKAINEFEKYAKVFISSEGELPHELEKYRFNIPVNRMHDAIAFSSLLFGESSTMAEESAMLGVPSIYLFTNSTYYTKHLENEYEIMFNYSESENDQIKAIHKGIELLQKPNLKEEWQQKRTKMLAEKIDVTAFLVWFVENYPASVDLTKQNPDFWKQFK
jgi:predicted glycosyltransferase